jgi:ubiquinone/menaquinone biosynthesis C-methylase UbiE
MQKTTGIFSILSTSWIYELFQTSVGSRKARKWLAENIWKIQSGQKVVDMGCGPGTIRSLLPDSIQYVGFDLSNEYIQAAQKRFGDKGVFIEATAKKLIKNQDKRLSGADVVLCNALLHHLNDEEVLEIFTLAKEILNKGGRFICIESVLLLNQDSISRWFINRDRGLNNRTESEWKLLMKKVFPDYQTWIVTSLLRIPYTHIIMQATNG